MYSLKLQKKQNCRNEFQNDSSSDLYDALGSHLFRFVDDSTFCQTLLHPTDWQTVGVSFSADLELIICWSNKWDMSVGWSSFFVVYEPAALCHLAPP